MYSRVAHLHQKIAGFVWVIDILKKFLQGFQKCKILRIGQCPSTLKLCLAYLLSFVEQASWTELARRGGLSDKKLKGAFVRVEKLSF